MSHSDDSYNSGALASPYRRTQISSNEQWIFGAVFAGLLAIGFAFGLYTGAPPAKPKSTETAELKKDRDAEKPAAKPADKPADKPANVTPAPEPKKEPEPEPKKTEPEPKKTEPEPKKVEPPPAKKEPEPKPPTRVVLFSKDIQPIFKAHCNECHGDAKGKPQGDVDTRTLMAMLKSKKEPLVAGKPDASSIYTTLKDDSMPKDRKALTDEQKKLIYDWIAGGAKPRRTVRRRGRSPAQVELTPAAGLE